MAQLVVGCTVSNIFSKDIEKTVIVMGRSLGTIALTLFADIVLNYAKNATGFRLANAVKFSESALKYIEENGMTKFIKYPDSSDWK